MAIRLWAIALLVTAVSCAPATAAPGTVQLRVEGASSTTFEGPVTTEGKPIDGGDGTGAHVCDGTNGGRNPNPGPTMISALDDAGVSGGWHGSWSDGLQDFLVDRIGPDANDSTGGKFWGIAINFGPPKVGDAFVGGCQKQVNAGDEVLFGYDFFSKLHLLQIAGSARATRGQPTALRVTDGQDGSAIDGATIKGAENAVVTGPDGTATATFGSDGIKRLKAERADSLRSNALTLCVSETGKGDCGVPISQLGTGAPAAVGKLVRDSKAPAARVSGPRDGARYRHGPRLLQGTATDDQSGVSVVKLALRRHVPSKNCRWWSGRRERFVGSHCHKLFFFAIGSDASWSYLLPRPLPPGRYVLDVKAFDRVRNRDELFQRGRNRIVFDVLQRT